MAVGAEVRDAVAERRSNSHARPLLTGDFSRTLHLGGIELHHLPRTPGNTIHSGRQSGPPSPDPGEHDPFPALSAGHPVRSAHIVVDLYNKVRRSWPEPLPPTGHPRRYT